VQVLLSCSSLVIFLNNCINVPSSFLRLEQSNFVVDDQGLGAYMIHEHRRTRAYLERRNRKHRKGGKTKE
jgi:hypothetical protein